MSARRFRQRVIGGRTKRHGPRQGGVLLAALSALSVLGAASAADAATVTTSYFTINAAAHGPSPKALFVASADGYNVTLRTASSRDRSGQWTPENPGYPRSPDVTGEGPDWFAFAKCVRHLGCPFSGSAVGPPIKLLNRATGLCLTTGHPWTGNGTKVHEQPCVPGTGPGFSDQLWTLAKGPSGSVIPTGATALAQSQANFSRCLDVTGFQRFVGTPLQTWACQPNDPWNQRFVFRAAAAVTCQVVVPTDPCRGNSH